MSSFLSKLKVFLYSPGLVFFLLEFFVLCLWWLAFYPGIMTNDSIEQWRQATAFEFNDWHPYLHTVLIAILRFIWDSPSVVVIVQIFCTSLLFAWIFHYLWVRGSNKFILVIFFLLTLISLPIGINTINLWKDVLFSLALIGLAFGVMVRFIDNKSLNKKQVLLLLVLALATLQFRRNGLIYLVFLPVVLLLYFPKKLLVRWFIALFWGGFVCFQFLLPVILAVTPVPEEYKYLPIYHATAGFYAKSPFTTLTPASKIMMESVMSPQEIIANYDSKSVDPLFWTDKLNRTVFSSKDFWDVIVGDFYSYNLWVNLPTFVGDRVNLFVATSFGYGRVYATAIASNVWGLEVRPILPKLHDFLVNQLSNIGSNLLWRPLVWSSWLGIVVCLVLFVDSFYRKKYYFQIFASLVLIQLPFLFFFSPSADWRYMYFMYLALLVVIPIYCLPRDKDDAVK